MAAITGAVLRNRVLQHLGVLGVGQTATAADAALVDAQVTSTIDGELTKYGALEASFTSNNIPDWAQDPLRDLIAFRVSPDFGINPERLQVLAQLASAARQMLLRHTDARSPATVKVEVRNKALEAAGAIGPGEVAPAAYADIADDAIDQFEDWLDENGTLPADLTVSTLANWAKLLYIDVIAHRIAPQVNADAARFPFLKEKHDGALREIIKRLSAPTTANSSIEVRNDVALTLGITTAGQEPTSAQADAIDDALTQLFDWLDEKGTVGYTTTTIPDWAVPKFVDVVAASVARQLGVIDLNTLNVLAAKSDAALSEIIRRFSAVGATGTKTVLRNQILVHLGVMEASEEPTAAQVEITEDLIDQIFDDLSERVSILQPEITSATIPDYAMTPLRDYIAYFVAPSVRSPMSGSQFLLDSHLRAESLLRQQFQDREAPVDDPIKTVYY